MTEENSMSNWFQDNLRIIISIGIVILLVFAIYSYSKRNSRANVIVDDSQIKEVAMTESEEESGNEINEIIDEIKDEENTTTTETEIPSETESEIETIEAAEKTAKIALEKKIAEEAKQAEQKKLADEREAKLQAQQETKAREEAKLILEKKLKGKSEMIEKEVVKKEATPEEVARKTAEKVANNVIESHPPKSKEGVILVVAAPKDSRTTLARKAVAQYIAKNNVSGLTPAHKIYIEDYVQKATKSNNVHPGTELGFAQNLISESIDSSKTLSSSQLQNLNKYAANVTSL
ncbi:MAG: hypothetical protein ABFQ53_00055 [Patescibacteria group bacterium]